MGSVVGKSIGETVERMDAYVQEKAKQWELEQQSRKGYHEVLKHKRENGKEYTIRKYEPYVAARLQNHSHNDGFLPLSAYSGGVCRPGSSKTIHPQNTRQEGLTPHWEWEKLNTNNPYDCHKEFTFIAPVPMNELVGDETTEPVWELRLPKKYTRVEDAPQPWDKRVALTRVEGTTCVVAEIDRPHIFANKINYAWTVMDEEVDKLLETVERADGYKVSGDPFLVCRDCNGRARDCNEIQIRIPVVDLTSGGYTPI